MVDAAWHTSTAGIGTKSLQGLPEIEFFEKIDIDVKTQRSGIAGLDQEFRGPVV